MGSGSAMLGGLVVEELAAWIHTVHKVGPILSLLIHEAYSAGSHQERRGEGVESEKPGPGGQTLLDIVMGKLNIKGCKRLIKLT